MELCVLKNRFDTFNHLALDRLKLMKKAMKSPDKEALMALARKQSTRWVELLETKVGQKRQRRSQSKPLAGYSATPRSGRIINRSL